MKFKDLYYEKYPDKKPPPEQKTWVWKIGNKPDSPSQSRPSSPKFQ